MRSIRNGFIGFAILLLTCLVILGVTHEGRVAIATGLLVSEVLPNSGWRPLAGVSAPPGDRVRRSCYARSATAAA